MLRHRGPGHPDRDLTRRFGDLVAVYDLGLEVEEGDVFGFVGPGGIGKTTPGLALTTLIDPTSG